MTSELENALLSMRPIVWFLQLCPNYGGFCTNHNVPSMESPLREAPLYREEQRRPAHPCFWLRATLMLLYSLHHMSCCPSQSAAPDILCMQIAFHATSAHLIGVWMHDWGPGIATGHCHAPLGHANKEAVIEWDSLFFSKGPSFYPDNIVPRDSFHPPKHKFPTKLPWLINPSLMFYPIMCLHSSKT